MSVGILGEQPRCSLGLSTGVQSAAPPFVSDAPIPFDTVIVDSASMADLASSSIIIPRDGLYLVSLSLEAFAADAGNLATLEQAVIYASVAGGSVRILAQPLWGERSLAASGREYAEWHGSGVFPCLAGDVLIGAYNLAAVAGAATHATLGGSRFDVVRLSS
jgi:hypothetical protein